MSFVGAGGKTSLIHHLARELEAAGETVLVTTTTHLAEPRGDEGRFAAILLRPELEHVAGTETAGLPEPARGVTLLAARRAGEPGKLKGIHPSRVAELGSRWDFVLVEADGARRLPIKAPAPHEPVLPEATDVVVGVIGLDALGWPMDERTVHRPERFAAVTGCAPGAPIGWDHVIALARHPEGLFKEARCGRVVLLNKADEAPYLPSPGQLGALGADLVLLSAVEEQERSFFTSRPERAR